MALRKLGRKLNNNLVRLGKKSYNLYRKGNKFGGKILSGYEKGSRKADKLLNFLDNQGFDTSQIRSHKNRLDDYAKQGRSYKKQARNEIEKQKRGIEDDGYKYLAGEGLRLYNKYN